MMNVPMAWKMFGALSVELLLAAVPAVDWNAQVLLAENLPEGQHTVKIEITGRKREPSTDCYVQIVGFNIRGGTTP